MTEIKMKPIGVIHTSYKEQKDTPIQPTFGKDIKGTVEIYDEYVDGLSDLEGFSHIYLLYIFHKSDGYNMKVKPYLDNEEKGLFATRSPWRPNPIGMSLVRLERIDGKILHVVDMDIIDGTPLLDIKPYIPPFEDSENCRIGWLAGKLEKEDNDI